MLETRRSCANRQRSATPSSVASPLAWPRSTMLEVRNLSKAFGGLKAVDELSFGVAQGDFVGVIGPNGAGKTTLMDLITGYLRPTSGEVLFEGRSLCGLAPYRISHRGIARTFQVVRPFSEMSVEDNVM